MAGGDEALLRADVPAMTPMEINDNTEPEKSSSPGLSRAIYFQLVITAGTSPAMTKNMAGTSARSKSFVASPGHDGEDALRALAPHVGLWRSTTTPNQKSRHHRACPGDPRPGFVTARKTWMAPKTC